MNTRFGVLLEEMKLPSKIEKKEHNKDKDKDKDKAKQKGDIKEREKNKPRETNKNIEDIDKKAIIERNTPIESKRTIETKATIERNIDKEKNRENDKNKKRPQTFTNQKSNFYVFDEFSFPELNVTTTPNKQTPIIQPATHTNYLNATTIENTPNINNLEKDQKKVGWVYYTREKNTNKIIVDDYSLIAGSIREKQTEKEYINEACKKICERYNQWKTKYIETWGYDEYEKMYLFSNYDYIYFDDSLDLNEYEMNDTYDDGSENDIDYMDDY